MDDNNTQAIESKSFFSNRSFWWWIQCFFYIQVFIIGLINGWMKGGFFLSILSSIGGIIATYFFFAILKIIHMIAHSIWKGVLSPVTDSIDEIRDDIKENQLEIQKEAYKQAMREMKEEENSKKEAPQS